MNRLGVLCAVAALTASFSTLPARAHCFELGLSIKVNGSLVATPIEIRETDTGRQILPPKRPDGSQPVLFTSMSTPFDCAANFRVDFNDNCTPDETMVRLAPGVRYTITLTQLDRSFDVLGSMPGGLSHYDDTWEVTTTGVGRIIPNFCSSAMLHELSNYGVAPPAATLIVASTQKIGSKTTYNLRTTAGGGNGAYSFAWTNAQQTSGVGVNPSFAYRTVWAGGSEIVTVQVTSRGRGTKRQVVLAPSSGPNP